MTARPGYETPIVAAWVTMKSHGHELCDQGAEILLGRAGQEIGFKPGGANPADAVST